jgi:Flp pilus assembly pilin Flp
VANPTHTKESARRGDVSHSFSVSTAVRDKWPVIESDSLSNTISHKPLTFEYLRRLRKSGQRGRAIEYTLIALLIAFAAIQAFFTVGAKAI